MQYMCCLAKIPTAVVMLTGFPFSQRYRYCQRCWKRDNSWHGRFFSSRQMSPCWAVRCCGACGITGFPSSLSATRWGGSHRSCVQPFLCSAPSNLYTHPQPALVVQTQHPVVPLHDLLGFRINLVATATFYSVANGNFSMWTLAFCISCNSVHNRVKSCKCLVQLKGHRKIKSGTMPGSWRFKKLS